MTDPHNITEVLEEVEHKVSGENLSMGKVVDTFDHRGFGPLLLFTSLIIILPTGGIPGVPTIIAVTIMLLAVQLMMGRDSPWLPKRIRKVSFKKSLFERGIDKVKPFTRKLDHAIKPRWKHLTCGIFAKIIGAICVLLAALLPFLELVPFVDTVPGTAIALLGVGLTARDGLFVIFGMLVSAAALGVAASLLL